jgi:AraC-like DNA-binding protein
MSLKIETENDKEFLSSFAKTIGSKVEYGRVNIPPKYGSGYVQGFLFGKNMRMIIRNYELYDDLLIKRAQSDLSPNMIMISFNNILKGFKNTTADSRTSLPSVTIATKGLGAELHLQGHTSFNAINLGIDATYLRRLLDMELDNTLLKSIVDNNQSVVYEQLVSVALQNTAVEITETFVAPPLQTFFYRNKAEELICYLFMELVQRKDSNIQTLNIKDIKMLYTVKDQITQNLAVAPVLPQMAALAGMSESKLKRLFKQVFGKNIYSYYQSMRMNEAAYLLKNKGLSVSEVGYALGFSNLGHFTKVFEEHIGMKPKRFSLG